MLPYLNSALITVVLCACLTLPKPRHFRTDLWNASVIENLSLCFL